MQVPRPDHLRPQHPLEAPPGLVGQRGVRQHPHAVDDAAERGQLRIHARQHGVDRRDVGHVSQLDLDPDPLPAQRLDGLPSLGIGIPAAVQHDGPGAPVRQPLGHGHTDAAKSAGYKVGPVLP